MSPDQHSPEVAKLAEALSKAQGEIGGAVKDSVNPFFKSTYANLTSVIEAVKPSLAKYGLSITQTTSFFSDGKTLLLVTTLLHSSGQWVSGIYPINPVKNDPQSLGSAISYAKRYALQAILCVPTEDDDGEAASGRGEDKGVKDKPKPEVKKPETKKPESKPEVKPSVPSQADWEQKPATMKQIKFMFTLAGEVGFKDEDIKKLILADYKKTSSKDLTGGEISTVIKKLELMSRKNG